MRELGFYLFVVLTFLLLAEGVANANGEIVPIQQVAQGQSLTGATLLNDSLYVNPAASAFTNVYSIDGTFFFPRSFAASVLDSRTSAIGGALGYFRNSLEGYNQAVQGAKLSLFGRLSEIFGIGLAGKAVWGPNTSGGAAGSNGKTNDIDTGLIANFNPIQLGFTVRNVFGGNSNMQENREWSLGGQVNYQQTLFLSLSATTSWSTFQPQWGVGVQYVSPYYFSLKGGYRIQTSDHQSFWSAGASFLSPRLSVHYSVEFPNQSNQSIYHVIGTTLLM